ncbi:Rrf2 family transcriptional regulator [Aliifodinibius sp. S!AR15-10]|uniref:RrF2 family transcriptional regulator n=1 Tax=Aliifodinibius sp. S!AR15-10 TaxID=2950437 RepID=UPI0028596B39|nr:Rrf2 family transcriptional regulator [Aliifodinibius sp. S!AR15-10]MDR8390762.1 Rrf2 family transcriptional regulator [Aliifodinibius sp. S!AR15-10]
MLLSKACIYGMRAALYLASSSNDRFIAISQISEDLDISRHFLTKILQQLTKADIMESMKGPKGGVRLKGSGDEITLVEIVAAIDGMDILTECALGLPGCGTAKPCPLHDQWADTRDEIRKMLEDTTLTDLSRKGKEGNLRITEDGSFDWLPKNN